MNKWTISKEFHFCYGHRVWSQTLNKKYSIDNQCACRHLHGHQGKLIVHLWATSLKDGMVTDFKHLNWMKKFIDEVVDHKMIIDLNDPYFKFFGNNKDFLLPQKEGYYIVDPVSIKGSAFPEIDEGLIYVDFIPTSENLCKWFYDIVERKMIEIDVTVEAVEFFETPKSRSYYKKYWNGK